MLIENLKTQNFSGLTNTIKDLFIKNALLVVGDTIKIDKPIMVDTTRGMCEIMSVSVDREKLVAKYDEIYLDEFGYETITYEIDLSDPEDMKHYLLFVCELVE